jgi:catechol 2,3-dioxygenase
MAKETAMTVLPKETRIGHVHLKVADLERAIGFYQDVLGFDLVTRYGAQAAFLSAGGYHHHIGLNTWESKGGSPAPNGHTGLYHTAFLFPDRASLGAALQRASRLMVPLIMACQRPFICAIRMATGWSYTATGMRRIGRVIRTETL